MQAALLYEPGKPIVMEDLQLDPPKTGEMRVRVAAHGVSVTAGSSTGPVSRAPREVVEQHFAVHDTPTRNDPSHRTVALPKPVTQEIAALFNSLFGRET